MKNAIDDILSRAVQDGKVPNLVAVVADSNGVIYSGSAGKRAQEGSDDVSVQSMYRLASMTKMITTVGALQLVEQGTIGLDQPVADFVPEFEQLQVLERMDGDTPVLSPARTPATVRQLITHTTGLGYWFWSEKLLKWEQVTETPNVLSGDARAFTAPMLAHPGTQFRYGMSIDYLGKVIEKATGKDLPTYLTEQVLSPLDMLDTTFTPSDEQRSRLVPVYAPDGQGGWVQTPIDWPTTPDWWAGGHAMYSTPSDYTKFQQMLLRGGEANGSRVLSSATVDDAFRSQIGELTIPEVVRTADPSSSDDYRFGRDRTWGWGLLINRTQEPGMRAPYSGAWAGLANTHFWIDRSSGVTGAIYTQFLPFSTPGVIQVYEDVERAVYAAM